MRAKEGRRAASRARRQSSREGVDYETLRQRHAADALALAPALIEHLEWPRDRLAAHRTERLRALVSHAVERSPWHRERLAGVDLEGFAERDLRQLPTMTKSDLMDHFDEIVTDDRLSLAVVEQHLASVGSGGYLWDRYTAITSGGSSGQRGVFVYDWAEWATYYLSAFRYLLRAKRSDPRLASRPATVAWVVAAHFTHPTAALCRTFSSGEFVHVSFPVTLPSEQIVAGLNRYQPDMLVAYPSALHALCFDAAAGRLRIAPRLIRTAAEPLLPEIRAAAEQTWGVGIRNGWGTAEGGGTAAACDHCQMHLSEDLVIVEPVDSHDRPVAPGGHADKVFLTNLYNHTMPLIRYELTDEITVPAERCPCGSAYASVDEIRGRLDDVFLYDDRRIHPHVFRSALARHGGIVEYQVRQTPSGATIAVRCQAPVDLKQLAAEIARALTRAGLANPSVAVTAVERVERDPETAKLKRFVPLHPEAPAK